MKLYVQSLLNLPIMQLSHCSELFSLVINLVSSVTNEAWCLLSRVCDHLNMKLAACKPLLTQSLTLNVRSGEGRGIAPVSTMSGLHLLVWCVKVIYGAE